jgi:hypothetical protein
MVDLVWWLDLFASATSLLQSGPAVQHTRDHSEMDALSSDVYGHRCRASDVFGRCYTMAADDSRSRSENVQLLPQGPL